MLIGPTSVPTALVATPSRTEPAMPPLPAVTIPAGSVLPQTLRAAAPATAFRPRNPLEDARRRDATPEESASGYSAWSERSEATALERALQQARAELARREAAVAAYARQAAADTLLRIQSGPPAGLSGRRFDRVA